MAEKVSSTHGQPQFIPERKAWHPPPVEELGKKDDTEKPRMALLPPRAIEQIARVLTHGAKHYGAWNWTKLENAQERYLSAALRHIVQYMRGQALDQEMQLPHLAAAAVSLMFLIELDEIADEAAWETNK